MEVIVMIGFDQKIQELLRDLTPRQRSVLKRRYGMGGGKPETLEAIGAREGITRERVRQIESDALIKLKKSPTFALLKPFETLVANLLVAHGGMVAEDAFLQLPEFASVSDRRSLIFFLDLCPLVCARRATNQFQSRWHAVSVDAGRIEAGLISLSSELAVFQKTLSESDLHKKLVAHLATQGVTELKNRATLAYLALTKDIGKNSWGEYGHTQSPFVHPRGMRESAYVALVRAGSPLHFREIARRIEEFVHHPVHVQTVHNELIKDPRFVLVGRGLYALGEWGYEPGFVKDVLVKLLSSRGALTREEILKDVSRTRQVKPSTIFINLQNKKLFKTDGKGTYMLVS